MSWSPQQLAAIETRGKNILVAAAAGSGKTSVLVQRIITRILDEQAPVDIDEILVVTFTNAAAAEMRSRVGAALTEALAQNPRSQHIERQLVLLNTAAICTLHAFCQNVVRQNFHMLKLDPKFRIAGEGEITLLKTEVLESLFESKYAEGEEAFLQLMEHYGDDQNDDTVHRLVLGLYVFSQSHPWPEKWLAGLNQEFTRSETCDVEDTPWSRLIREKVRLELEEARDLLAYLTETAFRDNLADTYGQAFAEDEAILEELSGAAAASWHNLADAMARCHFVKLPSAPKGTPEDVKKPLQQGRKKIMDKVKTFKALFFDRPWTELLQDMRGVAPQVTALAQLTAQFAAEFAKAKRIKNIVDFNDLEHFCLQVLRPEEGKVSTVAAAFQQKYKEVMVDEYQDTNGVQEAILQLVASPAFPNRFMVGDVKQSIYRFRLAEPYLFLEKYRRYPEESHCVRIDLSQNFRSRAGVLHAVNYLFCQLMSPAAAELEYGEAEKLNPGPDYPFLEGKTLEEPVEFCLIDRDEAESEAPPTDEAETESEPTEEVSGFMLEARYIAQRITTFMENGYQVYDKEQKGYRPLAWRDIVILLRSVKGKADILLEVLRQEAIPVYAELDAGYFREVEVQVMLSLLSVIDNPCQDIPLAAVLRSPIGNFTPAQLAGIRLAAPQGDLWQALQAAGCQEEEWGAKVRQFIAKIETWRNFSRRKGVPELIWQIYCDTGYYDYVGGMPGGMIRQANLRALYDRARQYETTSFRGLFRFLRFVERLQDKGSDLAIARALGESEDVVRVMSIHKSKGLEFPIVFVADAGKNINLQDSRELVLCHKDLGVGPYVMQPELRFRYPTLARLAISYKLVMEAKAEELRILYVALTRAREKLILVGSAAKLKERAAQWSRIGSRSQETLPDWLIAGAKSYLDWLGPALIRHAEGKILTEYGECASATSSIFAEHPSRWRVSIVPAASLTAEELKKNELAPLLECVRRLEPVPAGEDLPWVAQTLGWQYAYGQVVSKPAKLSVTEIKRRFDSLEEQLPRPAQAKGIFLRPRFIQESRGLSGAEAGVLMHSIMQHLPLQKGLDIAFLHSQLSDMVRREIILEEHLKHIDIQSIMAFFSTDLGQRMLCSPKVRRELPFSLAVSAAEFYQDMKGAPETIFVQGVIDALFDEGEELILVDYKTDKALHAEQLAKRYKVQLDLYAKAVETIYQQKVKEKYIYAFSLRKSIKI